jgi:hypothetical protein
MLLVLPGFSAACMLRKAIGIHRTGSTSELSQGMDAMHHLLLIAVAILGELVGIAFLVGRNPINLALRWKKE